MRKHAFTLIELLVTSSLLVSVVVISISSFANSVRIQIAYKQGQNIATQSERLLKEIQTDIEQTSLVTLNPLPNPAMAVQLIHLSSTNTAGGYATNYPNDDLLLVQTYPRDVNGALNTGGQIEMHAYCAQLQTNANGVFGKLLTRYEYPVISSGPSQNNLPILVYPSSPSPQCTTAYITALSRQSSITNITVLTDASFQIKSLRFWPVWAYDAANTSPPSPCSKCDFNAPAIKMEMSAQYNANNSGGTTEIRAADQVQSNGLSLSGSPQIVTRMMANRMQPYNFTP